jgi:hypothetical protein
MKRFTPFPAAPLLIFAACAGSPGGNNASKPGSGFATAKKAVENGQQMFMELFRKIFRSGLKMITVKTIGVWSSADMIVEEGKWILADKET